MAPQTIDERGACGAHGDHLAHAERQAAEADHDGAELPRRRHRGTEMLVIPKTPFPGLDAVVDFGTPLSLL
jgi:hypothetical protein